MKLQKLKAKFVKESMIYGGLIVALGVSGFLTNNLITNLNDDINSLKNEIRQIQQNALNTDKKYEDLTIADKSFKEIRPNRLPTESGYMIPQERIRVITPIIAELKDRFYLSKLERSLDKPELNDKDYDNKYSRVYENKVTLRFNALTDEIAYAIVEHFINNIPGFFILESINLNKTEKLSSDLIKDISSGKKPYDLVEGEAVFNWVALQKVDHEEENKNSNRR